MKSADTKEQKILDITKSVHSLFKLIGSSNSLLQMNHLLDQYSKQAKQSCATKSGMLSKQYNSIQYFALHFLYEFMT